VADLETGATLAKFGKTTTDPSTESAEGSERKFKVDAYVVVLR
jgi:hypothetical protein